MYYEINVSKNGYHFFATAERSCTNSWQAKKVYEVLKEKFPESEGYNLKITRYETVGKFIDPDKLSED